MKKRVLTSVYPDKNPIVPVRHLCWVSLGSYSLNCMCSFMVAGTKQAKLKAGCASKRAAEILWRLTTAYFYKQDWCCCRKPCEWSWRVRPFPEPPDKHKMCLVFFLQTSVALVVLCLVVACIPHSKFQVASWCISKRTDKVLCSFTMVCVAAVTASEQ